MGYTVPLCSPVASRTSKPWRRPRARATRTRVVGRVRRTESGTGEEGRKAGNSTYVEFCFWERRRQERGGRLEILVSLALLLYLPLTLHRADGTDAMPPRTASGPSTRCRVRAGAGAGTHDRRRQEPPCPSLDSCVTTG